MDTNKEVDPKAHATANSLDVLAEKKLVFLFIALAERKQILKKKTLGTHHYKKGRKMMPRNYNFILNRSIKSVHICTSLDS